jgi:hypothetical protein
VTARIKAMDDHGIDMQVVSIGTPGQMNRPLNSHALQTTKWQKQLPLIRSG